MGGGVGDDVYSSFEGLFDTGALCGGGGLCFIVVVFFFYCDGQFAPRMHSLVSADYLTILFCFFCVVCRPVFVSRQQWVLPSPVQIGSNKKAAANKVGHTKHNAVQQCNCRQ